jgi:hypothetical protein
MLVKVMAHGVLERPESVVPDRLVFGVLGRGEVELAVYCPEFEDDLPQGYFRFICLVLLFDLRLVTRMD